MKNVKKIVLLALAIALCFIGVYIQIPMPTGGMIHLGNFFGITFSIIFGPFIGAISSSLGMALFDSIFGFPLQIVIRTLFVKFLMALVTGLSYKFFKSKLSEKKTILLSITLGVLTNIILEFILNIIFNLTLYNLDFGPSIVSSLYPLFTASINGLVTILLLYLIIPKLKKTLNNYL